jgi:hypothetical protein
MTPMPSSKSAGLLWYEQVETILLDRYRAGQIDFRQFSSSLMDALNRSAFAMTETDLRTIQKRLFITMNTTADLLATMGHPLPGNDPRRPN